MSRFNNTIDTRVLRVPGVPDGRIDERTAGAFSAPTEAAGKALANLGELGQEIAVREQRLQDEILADKITLGLELSNKEFLAKASNAKSVAELDSVKKEYGSFLEKTMSRTKEIKGVERSNKTKMQLNFASGSAGLAFQQMQIKLEMDEARLIKNTLASDVITKYAIGELEYEDAAEFLSNLYVQGDKAGFGEAEAEAETKNKLGFLETLQATREQAASDDGAVDFGKYKNLPPEAANKLYLNMLARRETDNISDAQTYLRNIDRELSDAMLGVFDGRDVGSSEKAYSSIIEKIQGMKGMSESERRRTLDIVNEKYTKLVNERRIDVIWNRAMQSGSESSIKELENFGIRMLAESEKNPGMHEVYSGLGNQAIKLSGELYAHFQTVDARQHQEDMKGLQAVYLDIVDLVQPERAALDVTPEKLRETIDRYLKNAVEIPGGRIGFYWMETEVNKLIAEYSENKGKNLNINQHRSLASSGRGSSVAAIREASFPSRRDGRDFSSLGTAASEIEANSPSERTKQVISDLALIANTSSEKLVLNEYVDGLNDAATPEEKSMKLKEIGIVFNAAGITAGHLDKEALGIGNYTLVSHYLWSIDNAGKGHEAALESAVEVSGIQYSPEAVADAVKGFKKETRDRIFTNLVLKMKQSGWKGDSVDDVAEDFAEDLVSAGLDQDIAEIVAKERMGFFKDAYLFYALAENAGTSPMHLSGSATERAFEKASALVTVNYGVTYLGDNVNRFSPHPMVKGKPQVTDWSPEKSYSPKTANGDFTYDTLAYAAKERILELRDKLGSNGDAALAGRLGQMDGYDDWYRDLNKLASLLEDDSVRWAFTQQSRNATNEFFALSKQSGPQARKKMRDLTQSQAFRYTFKDSPVLVQSTRENGLPLVPNSPGQVQEEDGVFIQEREVERLFKKLFAVTRGSQVDEDVNSALNRMAENMEAVGLSVAEWRDVRHKPVLIPFISGETVRDMNGWEGEYDVLPDHYNNRSMSYLIYEAYGPTVAERAGRAAKEELLLTNEKFVPDWYTDLAREGADVVNQGVGGLLEAIFKQ